MLYGLQEANTGTFSDKRGRAKIENISFIAG